MPSVDGVNYPGPWEIRIGYNVSISGKTRGHELRMSVDVDTDPGPGSVFGDYDLVSRAGLYYTAETWTDAFVALMKVIYKTDGTIVAAELWKYDSGSFNAAFQSAYSIGVAGTSALSTQLWSQQILTFRSQNGGSARLNFMESVKTVGPTDPYPTSDSDIDDIFDLVTASQSPVIARDGGYLFAPLNYLPGTNEHLFKKDYRQ
jgi:hypothetical protein